jgi:CDP-diacylglycerol--glycerol-3-phosphate 3-phosphatidyltransferase
MIPVFVAFALYYGRGVQRGTPNEWLHLGAVLAFVTAALSDGLDGYIARRYNQRSRLGVILDPIADKGLLVAALLTLTFSNWHYELPLWFPVLVIGRDLVVVGGALLVHYSVGEVKIRPTWLGKTATALQMVAIAGVLLQLDPWRTTLNLGPFAFELTFLDTTVYLAGLFTLLSGIGYVLGGIRRLQEAGHTTP